MALGSTGPVEVKVSAATVAAAVSGFAVWVAQTYWFHGAVPLPVVAAVQVVVPAVCAFAAGWFAKHTPRADPDAVTALGRHERLDT